jgi:ATP-dependent RNA helicase SUPV3L1/SUV3
MLERLADLIRPRIFWKPEKEGDTRPDGSVEGGGFSVIPDMMSLVGCSGEEFADILRTLGYRCQKRKINPTLVGKQTPKAETPSDETPQANAETSSTPSEAVSTPEEKPAAEVTQTPASKEPDKTVAPSVEPAPSDETQTPTADAKSAEPTFLEVWLPGKKIPTNPKARRQHSKFAKGNKPTKGQKPVKKPNAKHKKPRPKKAPTKPDITDSPFAALKALRDDLSKSADSS